MDNSRTALSLVGWSTLPSGGTSFDGCLFTRIVAGPTAVRTVCERAVRDGATELKPPRKALFGSFAGFYRTTDAAVWKVVAEGRDGEVLEDPQPSELGALLGVADVKAAAAFYRALGMAADRSYGGKYADFRRDGLHRLGLMPRAALAKDAGLTDTGSGSVGTTLHARAASVPDALAAARAAGAREMHENGFTDPDGFRWEFRS